MTMTDSRAAEVLAAMRDEGSCVDDADWTAAIDRAIAALSQQPEAKAETEQSIKADAYDMIAEVIENAGLDVTSVVDYVTSLIQPEARGVVDDGADADRYRALRAQGFAFRDCKRFAPRYSDGEWFYEGHGADAAVDALIAAALTGERNG